MTRGFTDFAIKNLKPGPLRQEIPDPGCRGLYCVVQPSGRKSFGSLPRWRQAEEADARRRFAGNAINSFASAEN